MDAPGTGGAAPAPGGAPVAASGLEENVASALCYFGWFVTGILFLVLEPYNRNRTIRFHAFQAIFLSVLAAVLHFLIMFLAMLTAGFAILLSPLIWLAFAILWLFMMWKAYNREKVMLPFIGDLAQKQAQSA